MKRMLQYIMIVMVSLVMLTGCGSSSSDYGDGNGNGSAPNVEVNNNNSDGGDSNVAERSTMVVKKTGQTIEYEAFDDGYYQKGVTPSYSRSGDIVTDHITGLMWQDDREVKTIERDWQGAKDYCNELTLGGYDDWRLPTVVEFEGIVVEDKTFPAIDTTVFLNYKPFGYYWLSTTYASNTNNALYVHFYDGGTYYHHKSDNHYMRCVRSGQ